MMDEAAARYREALLETLRQVPGRTPLLLSGGMDSMTLLAGRLQLGERPDCYSYRLDGHPPSPDLEAAQRVCSKHGLYHTVVRVPSADDELVKLTKECVRAGGTSRKTTVQCLYALLPMLRVIHLSGFSRAMIGTGGVSEDNRRSKILGADYESNAAELEAMRRTNLLEGDPDNATETMKRVAEVMGVRLYEPFAMHPLAETALSIPYPEINRPVLKGIACRAFPEFFEETGDPKAPFRWWRENSSLQVNGGVRDLHERLLDLDVNRRGSKRVVGIYNDMMDEEQNGEQLSL